MEISPAEAQLILFSASVAARRRDRRDQAQRLICEVDWRRLTETLRLRRLLPTLGPHILELTELHADAGFSTAVEEAIATARRHATFLQLTSLRVMSALLDADIRCAPLKGPFLAEAIYGDAGRRLSSDIDLLVAPEQLRAATDIVRGLGYEAPADPVDASGLPQLHFLLIHKERALPPVELHWRVHSYERCFARELLLPPAGSRPGDWRPAPADELIALLLFYARDGFIDLRLASDVSGWWDRRGAELRRGAVEERLRTYPALARVVRASARAAEKVVGLPATRVFQDVPFRAVRGKFSVCVVGLQAGPTLPHKLEIVDDYVVAAHVPAGECRVVVRALRHPPSVRRILKTTIGPSRVIEVYLRTRE